MSDPSDNSFSIPAFPLLLLVGVFLGSSLTGCFSTTTAQLPAPPAPIEGDLAAVLLTSGERVSVGSADVELTEGELVVLHRSGSVVRRIPRGEIQAVEIAEFHMGRTVLAAFPLVFIAALGSSGPE